MEKKGKERNVSKRTMKNSIEHKKKIRLIIKVRRNGNINMI